ncbi:MAG: NAD-dependent epimerase/dehydratase family protein [Candidatus Niyogibacteria bacterium]|nr:NAD-dependent epimerase/dehydratase family protein [Candidatus Niyogibacteria bacterium]
MYDLNGKRIMVTGGLGFIGSRVVDKLVEYGAIVKVVDVKHPNDYAAFHNDKASYFVMDIAHLEQMREIFAATRPDFVIHCAAFARMQPSFEQPDECFLSNVVGARNILLLSKEFGVKRVVYSASSSAYGEAELPLTEDMKLAPRALNPYASSKRIGEMLCYDMGVLTGGPETVCLRYFNVYGPRQPDTAEGPYATVIGIFLDQYKAGVPMTVVPDGLSRRDYTHVYDVASANIEAMLSPKVGKAEIINVGCGKNYSIFEVAALIHGKPKEALVEGKDFVFIAPRKDEAKETLASWERARKLLGWRPFVTLEDGIANLKKHL